MSARPPPTMMSMFVWCSLQVRPQDADLHLCRLFMSLHRLWHPPINQPERTLRISWETPASSWKWHLGRSVIPLYCNHTDVSSFITAPSAKRAERLLAPVCGIPPLQTAHTHTARAVLKSSFAPLSSKIQICFKMTEHKIKPVLFLRISELVSVFTFQLFLVFFL